MKYFFRLGTRPESFMGDIATWDRAEKELKEILEESGKEYHIEEGDGAFYGPKIDIVMKDSLGRKWQMGTIQLDFQQPRNFKLKYIDRDGGERTPVVIHRVIYGSLERFIGILIEHFAGSLPTWLSPVQAMIIPITDDQNAYAQEIYKKLIENDIRVKIDLRSEKMGAKIRDAQLQKIPYMLVIGQREIEAGGVAVHSETELI
jgi:threonyl-tRNA synthetase